VPVALVDTGPLDKSDFATFRTPSGKPFKDLLAAARARR